MKSKYTFAAAIMLFALLCGVSTVYADSSNGCTPVINMVSQDPYPAVPDGYVKLVFEISDLDSNMCNGITVKFEPTYPFSLDAGQDGVQTWSSNAFAAGGYKQAFVVPYKVRVASDALEGDYMAKLAYSVDNNVNFNSSAVVSEFNVSVKDVQTNFDAVLQDSSSSQLSIGIVNTGKNTANSLVVKIPQQDGYSVIGTSGQIVGNLNAGDYTIVSFGVTSNGAATGNGSFLHFNRTNSSMQNPSFSGRPLQIQIFYTDGIGQRRNVTKEVPVGNTAFALTNRTARPLVSGSASLSVDSISGVSIWLIVGAVAVAGVAGFFTYKMFGKHHTGSLHKKASGTVPDWVKLEKENEK